MLTLRPRGPLLAVALLVLPGACSDDADAPAGDASADASAAPDGADAGPLDGAGDGAAPDPEAARLAAWCAAGGGEWAAVEPRVEELLAALTLEEKTSLMAGVPQGVLPQGGLWPTPGVARLGLPGFAMLDGPRGVSKVAGPATAFPVGMARAATWDPELEERIGAAMAREARAKGASVLLAPTTNILRHPRWGRAQETYGEDPHLQAGLGVAFVRGVQSERVLATVKHYAVNSIEDTRFDVDVRIAEGPLREVYLPHFRRIVQEGPVAAVMTAYNQVNGLYCAESPHLLRDILRGEWGFAGIVMSDWLLGTRSTAASLEAGLDLEMPAPLYYGPALASAVGAGEVQEALVDEAVRRILRAQLCYGLDSEPPGGNAAVIESPEHRALAREAAARAAVLLKNDGRLPLDAAALTRIVLVGPLAEADNLGDTGSSDVAPSEVVSVAEGLVAALGADRVQVVAGPPPWSAADEAALAAADAVVAVVGLTAEDEGESVLGAGDRESLVLPRAQDDLVAAAAALNPATVVVLEGSGAVLMPWLDAVAAVWMAWYPGLEGGHALADLLLGRAEPRGRLPAVWPKAEADLPVFDPVSLQVTYDAWHGYRYQDRQGIAPLFPFGYGLSWTTFELSAVAVAQPSVAGAPDATVDVSADVTNTGGRAGHAVVQVYLGEQAAPAGRPLKVLAGFATVALEPGETRTVTLEVPLGPVAIHDGAWRVAPGRYAAMVGFDAGALAPPAEFDVTGP